MAERSLRLGTLQEFHTPLGAVESSSERQSGEANDSGRASRPEADATRSTALSLLILDGEKALAEAVARALLLEQGIRSATGMSDPEAARSAIELGQLDVVVVGTDSDEWDSLSFLRSIARRGPHVGLVAMSGDHSVERVTAALLAGAISWVPKQGGIRELAVAVQAAARQHSSVPPALLYQVLRRITAHFSGEGRTSVFADLTMREQESLEYAVLGYSRSEIAAELGVSVNTVRTHLQHVLRKLNVHTTLEAVTLVLRERAAAE